MRRQIALFNSPECYSISIQRLREVVSAPQPVKQKLESRMSRSFLLLAVSGLAIAACQPASEAPQDVRAETPPVVEDAVEVAETVSE